MRKLSYIIKIWDFKNGNFLKRIDEIGPKNLMIITNDLKIVITVNSENIIELWNLENYEVVKKNDLIISKESRIINISTTGQESPAETNEKQATPFTESKTTIVELNSADTTALIAVKGIGRRLLS